MKRVTEIKIESYLFQYIRSTEDFGKVLQISGEFKIPRAGASAGYKYINANRVGGKSIRIELARPTLARIFGVVVQYRNNFREKLLNAALVDAKSGIAVLYSLDNTLRLWGISEDDYKRERAYKQWQRSAQYQEYKKYCHLLLEKEHLNLTAIK